MHDNLLRDVVFWRFLLDLDRDFAQRAREDGCPCGGRLHAANYFRNPRGGPDGLPKECCLRLQLVLRSRGVPQAADTTVGTIPRPQGLSAARDLPGGGDAAGTLAAGHA